jgi:hypothetical protein
MTLLPEVRRQLYTAVERQSTRRSIVGMPLPMMRPTLSRFRLGYLPLAASVLLVGAVVAVFLGVRGSRTSTRSGSGNTSIPVSAVPAGTPAAARFVVARMAVLRRPQTTSDLLPPSVRAQLKDPLGFSAISSLTRLAATINGGAGRPGGQNIYVVVGRPGGYPVDIATAVLVTHGPRDRYLVTPPEVVEEEIAIPTGGLAPTVESENGYFECRPEAQSNRRSCQDKPFPKGEDRSVAVVPDGVTRVKWVMNRFPSANTTRFTVYPRVQNNVAFSTTVPITAGLVRAIWYGADGQVIKPIPVIRRAARRRPVPAVVGRSFAALRGVPANHGVPIANHIGMRLWLVPHPTQVCEQDTIPNPTPPRPAITTGAPRPTITGGGGDCVPISMALAGNFTTGLFGPKRETLIGVAPNGNPTVRLTLNDGSSEVVPVSQNVYIAETSKHFTRVTLKDANGVLRTWRTP